MTDDQVDSPALWSREARQFASDALQMLQLRRELAELEIRHDASAGRRLAIVGGAGTVLILSSLPLWLNSLAIGLSTWTSVSHVVWLLLLAAFSFSVGVAVTWSAYRRFRREFSGLRGTLAELNEDVIWLREWTERSETSSTTA